MVLGEEPVARRVLAEFEDYSLLARSRTSQQNFEIQLFGGGRCSELALRGGKQGCVGESGEGHREGGAACLRRLPGELLGARQRRKEFDGSGSIYGVLPCDEFWRQLFRRRTACSNE